MNVMPKTHALETGARKLASVFHASCKISGATKKHCHCIVSQLIYIHWCM